MNISKAQKLLEVMEHEPANRAVGIQRLLSEQYGLEEKFFSRKTLSTAKDVIRGNFHKYLPDQYKRAGKIARTGMLGLALYGGTVGNIAGTAGNLSAMHPDERSYVKHQVSRVIHEPEYRAKAFKLISDKVKNPETYKSLGRSVGMTASNFAMPIPRLASNLLPKKEKTDTSLTSDEKQVLHGAKELYGRAEPATTRLFPRLKQDPTFGGAYDRGERNAVKQIQEKPKEMAVKGVQQGMQKFGSFMASYAKK